MRNGYHTGIVVVTNGLIWKNDHEFCSVCILRDGRLFRHEGAADLPVLFPLFLILFSFSELHKQLGKGPV